MKRLLLAPLLLVMTSCSYGSLYEAETACLEWQYKGGTFHRSVSDEKELIRWCETETITKQVLGLVHPEVISGKTYSQKETHKFTDKVVKRFRF